MLIYINAPEFASKLQQKLDIEEAVLLANPWDANGIFAMRNAEVVLDACSLREPLNHQFIFQILICRGV